LVHNTSNGGACWYGAYAIESSWSEKIKRRENPAVKVKANVLYKE